MSDLGSFAEDYATRAERVREQAEQDLNTEEYRDEAEEQDAGEPLTVTWDQYMAERAPSVPSLLGDALIVKSGGYTLLGGDTGVGKTILLSNLLLALADSREEFLGLKLPGRPVRSLILEAEGNRHTFRDWIAHIARSMGIRKAPAISFHQRNAELAIDGPNLERMITESRAEIVFLDTIGRFWTGEENSSTEWRSGVVLPLAKLGVGRDCAFVFGDHYNKSLERQGTGKVRGTPAKIQDCGAAMRLEIGKGGQASRLLHIDRVRDGALPDPPVIALTLDLKAGTVARDTNPEAVPVSYSDSRLSDLEAVMREHLPPQFSRGELEAAIRNRMGLERSRAGELISTAVRHHLLEQPVARGPYRLAGKLFSEDVR